MLKLVEELSRPASLRIYGPRLRDARLLRGLTAKETAQRLEVGPVKYSRMENADDPVTVTEAELERIAASLSFSTTYLQTPPTTLVSTDDLCFRAKKSLTKTAQDVINSWATICGDLLHETFKSMAPVPVLLPNFPAGTSPEVAARETRTLWGYDDAEPIPHLTRRLERSGIYVFSAPFESGDRAHHDALSTWVGERREHPIVLVRDIDSWERIRLSLAHEVGHLALHRFGKPELAEEEAFDFGAALLMPAAAFRKMWPNHVTLGSLKKIKLHWGVSLAALIERAFRMGLLRPEERMNLYKQLSRRDRQTGITLRAQEPGYDDREPERPLLVSKLLEGRFGPDSSVEVISRACADRPSEFIRPLIEGQYRLPHQRANVVSLSARRAVN
ncbi:helix-turn-helix domain-containing protein [Paenarthrobacter sp. NPDC091669]|uniref:helix-turn-helix domain-containing protein n=1 Tax=Paenarthrobacter sp. NPDC091669 TaxID=3364384 RepID=UPI0037FD2D06